MSLTLLWSANSTLKQDFSDWKWQWFKRTNFHWYWCDQEFKHREKCLWRRWPHGSSRNRSGRLPSCSLRTGMAALASSFFCAPFLSICMCDSPLCLSWFLLLGVSSCRQEEAWWLNGSSCMLCAMLRFRRLSVNAMGKQRYHKMKYRVVLLAGIILTKLNNECWAVTEFA